MPRARRSTRVSGAKTNYTTDPFEIAGVGGESDIAEAADPAAAQAEDDDDEGDSDEEFQDAPGNGEGAEEDEDEQAELAYEDENEEPSTMDIDEPTPTAKGRGKKKNAEKENKTSHPTPIKKRRPDGATVLKGNETHSRGIVNPLEHVGKSLHLQFSFGTDERDLLAILYARDRWSKGIDSGFPSRASLNAVQTAPDYTYGPTFGAEPEDVGRESTRGWDWYYDGDVGERFGRRQRLDKIDENEGRRTYMPVPKPGKHTVLIGPADGQKRFALGQFELFNFGEAWRESKSGARRKHREGWIINLGQKIQAMAWASNQDGLVQYLAVAAPITEKQKSHYPDPLADKAALAFRPSAPYPSALQIWAFRARRDDSPTKTLDMEFKPRLRLALCTEWGDLRRIAWCPSPRAKRDEDDENALKGIGLLACVWGDGCVRVLDIKTNRDPDTTEFCKSIKQSWFTRVY